MLLSMLAYEQLLLLVHKRRRKVRVRQAAELLLRALILVECNR